MLLLYFLQLQNFVWFSKTTQTWNWTFTIPFGKLEIKIDERFWQLVGWPNEIYLGLKNSISLICIAELYVIRLHLLIKLRVAIDRIIFWNLETVDSATSMADSSAICVTFFSG